MINVVLLKQIPKRLISALILVLMFVSNAYAFESSSKKFRKIQMSMDLSFQLEVTGLPCVTETNGIGDVLISTRSKVKSSSSANSDFPSYMGFYGVGLNNDCAVEPTVIGTNMGTSYLEDPDTNERVFLDYTSTYEYIFENGVPVGLEFVGRWNFTENNKSSTGKYQNLKGGGRLEGVVMFDPQVYTVELEGRYSL